jgi:hypothetical protein
MPPHLDLVVACLFVHAEEVVVIELRRARRIFTAGVPTRLGLRISHLDEECLS